MAGCYLLKLCSTIDHSISASQARLNPILQAHILIESANFQQQSEALHKKV